jgi:hypothetical protein
MGKAQGSQWIEVKNLDGTQQLLCGITKQVRKETKQACIVTKQG